MSTRSWHEVRADMDLDEARVDEHRERMLAEIEEFRRSQEHDEQQD